MSRYITVDGGTSNTRVSLVEEMSVTATKKIALGAKDCAEDNAVLKTAIKEAIDTLLGEREVCNSDIKAVIFSGMIGSENGLFEVAHIMSPAGISELHGSMVRHDIKEISEIPMYFIRGVKTLSESLEKTDIMRGEETEVHGLSEKLECDAVYILPGSHSKWIFTDKDGKICGSKTMLTGEMLFALSNSTILKNSVKLGFDTHSEQFLMMGYEYCLEHGINDSLFKTRILKNVFAHSEKECYSFFLGAVLTAEIEEIKKLSGKTVIFSGKAQIKNAMLDILKRKTDIKTIDISEEITEQSVSVGAVKIFEYEN